VSDAVEVSFNVSSEEHSGRQILEHVGLADQAGFRRVWISDHYHPWVDRQGHSPFVWSVIGGIAGATSDMTVGTAVTCPTMRIHPAVVAQAAATAAEMLDGRFVLGVGSGENLNEHIFGDRWPPTDVRLAMLEEAVAVMRQLWTGEEVTHRGEHYTVEDARIYTRPAIAPQVWVSAFGPKAADLAGRIGDGLVVTSPDADTVDRFDERSGGGRPKLGLLKVCWGRDASACRKLAYEIWPTSGVPGELSQELRTPSLFEQASSNVSEEQATEGMPAGPDVELYVEAVRQYAKAGITEVTIHQVGDDQAGFLEFWVDELAPALRSSALVRASSPSRGDAMADRPSIKNDEQYEALRDKGMSKTRAAKIANSPDASSHGGKKSGSGGDSRQGGTTAQKKAAGRKGGKATAAKRS
jgi:G6PDH family F420-dependent oxidoreductase